MLSNNDLVKLKQGGESERVELKPSIAQGSSIRRAMCAFANDLGGKGSGGVIFVGLNEDGTCTGIGDSDNAQQKLANWAHDGTILPLPDVEIYKQTINDCDVIVVEVRPSNDPPVRYQGNVWVRVGTTNHRATPEQERRLVERRRGYNLPFDLRPAEGIGLSDLNLDYFQHEYLPNAVAPAVLEENQRTLKDQMSALRLFSNDQPTNGALLVLGYDPRAYIPGAYIQFLRIHGKDIGDPIQDEKTLSGSLPKVMAQLDDLIDVHIQVAVDLEKGSREQRRPDYPVVALQQLVRNALIHRNYESTHAPVRLYWFKDRIEISNPGGLYGQVTRDNFGQGVTDYRNPLIAEAMHVLGYVQRFGYGIPLARRHLLDNGNPEPEFLFESTYVLATVRTAK